jgi:hypothetical protein
LISISSFISSFDFDLLVPYLLGFLAVMIASSLISSCFLEVDY